MGFEVSSLTRALLSLLLVVYMVFLARIAYKNTVLPGNVGRYWIVVFAIDCAGVVASILYGLMHLTEWFGV